MVDKLDMIHDMVTRQGERLESMGIEVGKIGLNCAVLIERAGHLASREDVSQAIATHAASCRSRAAGSIAPGRMSAERRGAITRLIKAIAALFAIAATALAAWFGLSPP